MDGTPDFRGKRGKIVACSLMGLVALLSVACFNIVVIDPQSPPEEPPLLNEPLALLAAPGDQDLPPELRSSIQPTRGADIESGSDVILPTVDAGPVSAKGPEPTYRLTVNGVPAIDSVLTLKGGTVTVSAPTHQPAGYFRDGDRIRLTAIPEKGYQFDTWEGGCISDANVCTLTVDGNQDLTAGFVPLDRFFGLDLIADPLAGGQVLVQPAPNAPDGGYMNGTRLELKAINSEGFGFAGWEGDCFGDHLECRIVMNNHKSVKANFAPDYYTLTINRILVDGAGVSLGHGEMAVFPFFDTPDKSFGRGAVVSLTVEPDEEYAVINWSGDCSELEPDAAECTLYMDSDKHVEVTFTQQAPAQEAAAEEVSSEEVSDANP